VPILLLNKSSLRVITDLYYIILRIQFDSTAMEMTHSATVGEARFTFDINYHDTVRNESGSVRTFFLDAKTGVLRIKSMYPEGDTRTMLIDDWIEEYGQ
jgi:hypothetical protein